MKTLTLELQKIDEAALFAAGEFKKSEKRLIETMIDVENSNVFLKLGYSSLFKYATERLILSESVSYNAIAVARKAREIPALKEVVQELGISKIRKMVSVITPENQSEWVMKAKTISTR